MQLSGRTKVRFCDQVCFIVLPIPVTVALNDILSKWIRLNLIGRHAL